MKPAPMTVIRDPATRFGANPWASAIVLRQKTLLRFANAGI
jgi:hypothetical protein